MILLISSSTFNAFSSISWMPTNHCVLFDVGFLASGGALASMPGSLPIVSCLDANLVKEEQVLRSRKTRKNHTQPSTFLQKTSSVSRFQVTSMTSANIYDIEKLS
jgi:hypothetical protein